MFISIPPSNEGVANGPDGSGFGLRSEPVQAYDRSTADTKIGSSGPFATPSNQQGTTLIVSLVMLTIVLMLSTSFAGIAIMGEKAARNERDKQIAMHAAEAALADAEKDIENSDAATSRSTIFSPYSAEGFTDGCGKGDDNPYQGLCINNESKQKAAWLTVDLANTGISSPSVQFGRFTGQIMPSGAGPFPGQLPRYIIELMPDKTPGQPGSPTGSAYIYRITAVGFGTDSSTQIVLQSIYRKT